MKINRISKYNRNMAKERFDKNITINPIKNKEKILAYLKKFDDWAFTSMPVYDIYTGEKVEDADNAKTDGTYIWYCSEIYHFEKYNLKLNKEFIKYLTPQM